MTETFPIELFGREHLLVLLFSALGCWAAAWAGATARDEPTRRWRAGLLVALILLEEAGHYATLLWMGEGVTRMLPLHVCGLAIYLIAAMLAFRAQSLFQVCYYWGMGGAIPSMLTPDMHHHFPHPIFISYFVSHTLMVMGVCHVMTARGWRPTFRGALQAFAAINALAVASGFANWMLGTNYMYLCGKPGVDTPMSLLGPWPWYILQMEPVALGVCLFVYLPFMRAEWRARSGTGALSPDTRRAAGQTD